LAVKSDGSIVGWGYNAYGQATPPTGPFGAVAVAAGFYDSLAMADRPAAPSTLAAIPVATNEVDLSWFENSSGAQGFQIERAVDALGLPGTWTQIATVGADVTSYSDTGVVANATYWYRVRAYNSCNQSPFGTVKVVVVLLDDTWASGSRTNQNLPTSSAWWSSDVGNPVASPGSMIVTVGVSSVMALTYFTDYSDFPVQLNVGDTLTATFDFIFDGITAAGSSSQGFRFGLFNFADSSLNPKRVTADGFGGSSQGNGVQGYALFGKVYGTFSDDQPIDIRKQTNLSSGNLIGTSADWTSVDKEHLSTGSFSGFANLTPYSLQMILQRNSLTSLTITVTWSNMISGATLSESFTDNSAVNFN
jgi:hypothetical protein